MKYLNILILILILISLISGVSGIQHLEYNNGITTIEYYSGYSRIIPFISATILGLLFYIFYKRFEVGYLVGWIILVGFYISFVLSLIVSTFNEEDFYIIMFKIFSITAVTFLFGYWGILWKKQKSYFNVKLN